jgi:hypothetical protein
VHAQRDPVYLDLQQRRVALWAIVMSLLQRNIEVRMAALEGTRLHLLAPFPDRDPRHWVAIAKKESSHALEQAGMNVKGGVWEAGCKCWPIFGPAHEAHAADHIARCLWRGAEVWKDGEAAMRIVQG